MQMCILNLIWHWSIEIIVLETNSAKYVKFPPSSALWPSLRQAALGSGLMSTYSRNNPPHSPLLVYIIRTFLHRLVLSAGGMQWWYCQYCQTTWWSSQHGGSCRALPGSRAHGENTRMMRCEPTCFIVKGWGSLTFSIKRILKGTFFMNLTWENVGVGHYRIKLLTQIHFWIHDKVFLFRLKGPWCW